MIRHPSITTNDFDITPEGGLVVKISPPAERYKASFDTTMPLNIDINKVKGPGSRGVPSGGGSPTGKVTLMTSYTETKLLLRYSMETHTNMILSFTVQWRRRPPHNNAHLRGGV